MKLNFLKIAFLSVFVFVSMSFSVRVYADITTSTAAPSASSTELQAQLAAKQQQIAAIGQQLQAANANLQQVQSQRVTLQQQVDLVNGNISSLNLGIQNDTLTAQQLQLQIEQLGGDVKDISSTVVNDQAAIGNLLKEIQKNDGDSSNALVVFLREKSLADAVIKAQNLHDVQNQLQKTMAELKDLHQQYNDQITESSAKESSIAMAQVDLQNKVSILQDEQQQKKTLLTSTKNQESVFQQQLSALQQQQDAVNSQIESIDAQLRTKIDHTTLPITGVGVLSMPVQGDTQSNITQGYGATSFAKTEYVHHWHNGLDFAASIGTPILAAANGIVDATGNEDLYCYKAAYGKFITIDHENGLTTLYGHLSKILVTKGQSVTRGQVIGYSGNTGDATGPHLHFTVFAQSTYYLARSKFCGPLPQGGDVDPSNYLF